MRVENKFIRQASMQNIYFPSPVSVELPQLCCSDQRHRLSIHLNDVTTTDEFNDGAAFELIIDSLCGIHMQSY